MEGLYLSPAQPEPTALVIELVTEHSARLAERAIQQWPSPPWPEVHELLAREIAAGDCRGRSVSVAADRQPRGGWPAAFRVARSL